MYTCIYRVLYCLSCVFVLFLSCISILICLFVLVYGLLPPSDKSIVTIIIIIIIIRDNEKGTCVLIDVVISGDRNVIKKEAEKILKYKDLSIEIQRM